MKAQKLLALVVLLSSGMTGNLLAANNTPANVINGSTDLTATASFSSSPTYPSTNYDVIFTSTNYSPTAFTLNLSENWGTLDDLSSTALTIDNTSTNSDTLSLNQGTNHTSGANSLDYIYVASGANMSIGTLSGTNLILDLGSTTTNTASSGNIDNNGTLTIASALDFKGKFGSQTLSFTGSGTTTVSGAFIVGNSNPIIINTTGTVNLSGGDGASTTTVTAGTLNVTSGITGNVVVNGGTFSTSGGGYLHGGSGVSLTVNGGTVTIAGSNQNAMGGVTGTTIDDGATLTLNSSISASNLILGTNSYGGGGELFFQHISGQSSSTTTFIVGTILNPGSSIIVNLSGTLALNAITRNTGSTVDFDTSATTISTTTTNAIFTGGQQTILGGYATFNDEATWAVSGAGGAIAGLASGSYTNSFTAAKDVNAPATTSSPGSMTINSLRFNNAGISTVNLGGAMTIATGGILETASVGANAVSINSNTLTSGNGQDLIVIQANTSAGLTIGSQITGTNGLTMSGGGVLTLTGSNNYTGVTTVDAGTLQVGNPTALGNGGAVFVVANSPFATGAALDLDGTTMTGTNALTLNGTGISGGGALTNSSNSTTGTYAGLVTLGSSGVSIGGAGNINLSNTGTITGSGDALTLNGAGGSVSSIIGTGAGTLTVNSTGVWILTGSNTYSGKTTVSAGTLSIGSTGVLAAGSAVTVTNSGTLAVNGKVGGTVSLGGSATLSSTNTGAAASIGALTVAGGTITLTNGSATTQLNGSTMTLNSDGTINIEVGAPGFSSLLDLSSTASFTGGDYLTVNITGVTGATTNTAYTFFDASSGLTTNDFRAGTITSGGGITSADTMSFALSGSDVTVTINAPSPSSAPPVAYWSGANSVTWLTAGNFSTTNSGGTPLTSTPGSVTDVVFSTSSPTASNLSTTLDGPTTINSLTFNATSGAVTIASGTNSGSLTLEAATTTSSNGINTAPNAITVTNSAGAVIISAPVALGTNQTWTNSSTNTLTVSGQVSGGFALTTAGSGTVDLSNTTNTYGGGTTINAGVLQIAASGSLGTGTNVSIVGGSSLSAPTVLQYDGTNSATLSQNITITTNYGLIDNNSSGHVLTLSGQITKNGSKLILAGGQFVVSGVISGTNSGSDVVLGSSTYGSAVVGLTTNNTYNGPTSITNGSTLLTGINNALPTSPASDVTFGAAGESGTTNTLDLLGTSETVASLNVGSTSNNVVNQVINSNGTASPSPAIGSGSNTNPGTLTVNYTTTNTPDTFSGSLGGGGSANNFNLVKSGAGTLVLSGSNSYSGSTTVSGGTLQVTGTYTGGGGTTVGNGSTPNSGTLSGHGTVGAITVAYGGTLSPGDSTTTLGPLISSSNTVNNVLTGTGLTLEGGATLSYNLYSGAANTGIAGGTPGSAPSTLAAGGTYINLGLGTLTLTGLSSADPLTINLNSTGIGGYGVVTNYTTLVGTPNVYDLIEFGSSAGLTNAELANYLVNQDIIIENLTSANINPSNSAMLVIVPGTGGEEYLQLDIVPEPGTWAMFALGLGFLFFVMRKRMSLTTRKP